LTGKNLAISDGGTISAIAVFGQSIAAAKASAGNLFINEDEVDLNSGGLIATTTSSRAKAGSIVMNIKEALNISGEFDRTKYATVTNPRESDSSGILSNASYVLDHHANRLGAGGSVEINSPIVSLSNHGLISVATEGQKSAGTIVINAALVKIDNASINAQASATSQGQTGNISINADQGLYLRNHGEISIKNQGHGHAKTPNLVLPAPAVTVTAGEIDLKDSEITTASTDNVAAGNINLNAAYRLTMDPSFIRTTANLGNGGDITVNSGQLIYLQNSGFITSVQGANSRGGNINITTNSLIMNNGVIQANAQSGAGGDINLKALYGFQGLLLN
jgi:large exoprotein involved in heme utilization and adhesion